MKQIRTTQLTHPQKAALHQLWNREYPVNLAHESLEALDQYLATLEAATHILIEDQGTIIGWMAVFTRERERWFAMILHNGYQGKGLGKQLLAKAKRDYAELNGWVIDHARDTKQDGNPYASPVAFYLKQGFQLQPNHRLELEKISAVKIHWRR